MRAQLAAAPLYVSEGEAAVPHAVDIAAVRHAIHEFRKIRISYADESGNFTRRTIWPIAMAYYVDVTLIAAWCELRKDYRHFRVERIQSSEVLEEKFPADNGRLLSRWLALQNARSSESDARRVKARAVSSLPVELETRRKRALDRFQVCGNLFGPVSERLRSARLSASALRLNAISSFVNRTCSFPAQYCSTERSSWVAISARRGSVANSAAPHLSAQASCRAAIFSAMLMCTSGTP